MSKKLAIIGFGNMGSAIYEALIKNKVFSKSQILVCDKEAKPKDLVKYTELPLAITDAKYILLAVKPQNAEEIYSQIKNLIKKEQVVISIMAGVNIKTLKKETGGNKVVRCMPNLPLKIGQGVTGWISSKPFPTQDKIVIKNILKSFGTEIEVKSEDKIDSITSLSGSGPAYFCYFSEALAGAAVKAGFTCPEAQKIVLNTLFGTAELLKNEGLCPASLRKQVTSKKGTTEAAIKSFDQDQLKKIIEKGVKAAEKRAKDLSN